MTYAKPYTLTEATDLATSHYGASAARVRATCEALERAEAALAAVTAERDWIREALERSACAETPVEPPKTPDDVWCGCRAEMPMDPDAWCPRCAALASTPAPESSLVLKFNGGDSVFLWEGSGLRKLSEFDLFTRTEGEALKMRVAEAVKKHAIDAAQQGDCGCNYAPCEHDDQRFRSARRVRELDLSEVVKGVK